MQFRRHEIQRDRIIRFLRRLAIFYVAVLLPLRLVMIWGFRSQSRPFLNVVRAFNKRLLNPLMLRLAGRKHWYAAAIHHVGRRSGRSYVTPVWVEPIQGGFLIPLPYGTEVDWLRNVRAAKRCTIQTKGVTYRVGEPVLMNRAIAEPLLPRHTRVLLRTYGVRQYLHLRRLDGVDEENAPGVLEPIAA
jgi:deazaflavin-dependent oxidoreductase (nitroreductase family)